MAQIFDRVTLPVFNYPEVSCLVVMIFAFRMEGQVELNVKGDKKKGTFGF